jgi:amidohydrolase
VDLVLLRREAESLTPELVSRRRDLHRNPELAYREKRTAGVVASGLSELGLIPQTGVAETGVVSVLEGARAGPTVLLRFDMDALPIMEATQAEYASTHPGVMHACGHDGHVAVGLAVARLLQARRGELRGRIKFVFQPAEEGEHGAERMLAEGVLENPSPDFALAMHLWNEMPTGWIGVTPGPAMAGAEKLEIIVRGRGGHGATPDQAVDPVIAAAHVVTALQSVVSRNVEPRRAAVVSVTQVQAGEAFNVIPSETVLRGTIRTFEPEVRRLVLERVEAVAVGVAEAMGCQASVRIEVLTPAVMNDPRVTRRVSAAATRVFPDIVVDHGELSMVSEDMAYFLERVPGCMIFVGSNTPERTHAPHHSPRFDFDESALPCAAGLLTAAAIDLLEESVE